LNKEQDTVSFTSIVKSEQVTVNSLANWLRAKLDLPLEKQIQKLGRSVDLLEYVREKLYDLGIYIFKDSFRDNNVSGLCLYDEIYPIILLNNKTTFGRQLFTIFHELYHIFMKETDLDFTRWVEERDCNQFASEFLIPAVDFNIQISNINSYDDETIYRLAGRYCVSVGAIKYRLFKAQKISKKDYEESLESDNIRIFNAKNAGGNYYNTKISYLGNSYLKQVFAQYYSGRIPLSTAAIYTQLKSSSVSKLAATMTGGEF
jgi:Zn-dependent peptidase ImmA (M78 family)